MSETVTRQQCCPRLLTVACTGETNRPLGDTSRHLSTLFRSLFPSNTQHPPTSSSLNHRYNPSTPKPQPQALLSTSPVVIQICSAFALAIFILLQHHRKLSAHRHLLLTIDTIKMSGYTRQYMDARSVSAMNGSVQRFALHLFSLYEHSLIDLP
jgi:hypothetical protein